MGRPAPERPERAGRQGRDRRADRSASAGDRRPGSPGKRAVGAQRRDELPDADAVRGLRLRGGVEIEEA